MKWYRSVNGYLKIEKLSLAATVSHAVLPVYFAQNYVQAAENCYNVGYFPPPAHMFKR